jgi:membrane-associated phospholipid phosphatase
MTTGSRFRWWCLFLVIAGLLLLVSFYLDARVRVWIVQHQDVGIRNLMRSISRFGDWPEHIALGLIFLGLAWWRHSKKWMRVAGTMILACAMAGAVARVVKISAGRARPSVQADAAWSGPNISSRYNAFPSGHTAASTAFFASLAIASWRIGTPLLLIPLLIAFSRMYVAAHYLSDVVCAALTGLVIAYLIRGWIPLAIQSPEAEIQG